MSYKPSILYEDNHLLVINKPAGWLVQGDRTGDQPLVDWGKDYLKKKYNKPGQVFLGVVHRLDRPVSGVVVFARTSKALPRMNQIFKSREVKKTYWALVQSAPPQPEGKLVHWLLKDSAKNKTKAYTTEKTEAKRSELTYRLLSRQANTYLLEVNPLTGRPHQIRVQLAAMGCPIIGDVKYGFSEPTTDASIGLHARSLSFVHPVRREPVTFQASVPELPLWQPFAAPSETTRNH